MILHTIQEVNDFRICKYFTLGNGGLSSVKDDFGRSPACGIWGWPRLITGSCRKKQNCCRSTARARGQTNQRWSNDVLQGIDGHGSTPTVGQRRAQCVAIALRDAVKCAHLAQGSEHSMHRWVGKIQRRRQHCHACTQWSGFGHGQQQAPRPGDGLRTVFCFRGFLIVHMVDTSPWLE